MGRLATTYAGQRITYRVPFAMTGFVDLPIVTGGAPFAERQADRNFFLHNGDKPFEVHRMRPTALAVNAGVFSAAVAQETLIAPIQVALRERSRNQAMTASFVPLLNLIKGSAEMTWEWAEPMTLVRGEGYFLKAASRQTTGDPTRLNLTFEGFLLILAPASDSR